MKIYVNRALPMLLGATLATAALALPSTGNAATIPSKWKSNAAGVCQSAFSSGAGAVIRARPLAVQNEGAANAFVTCSLPYNDEGPEQPNTFGGMGARLVNNTPTPVVVSCTLVSGTSAASANYVVKETNIAANSANTMFFDTVDLPGAPATILAPNISCSLPSGTGIIYVYYYFDRQIGA